MRDHADQMLSRRAGHDFQRRPLLRADDGNLPADFDLGEQLARPTIQAMRDLQQHGDRRNCLEILHLVDRARGDTGEIPESLQRQACVAPPAAKPMSDPLEVFVHGANL